MPSRTLIVTLTGFLTTVAAAAASMGDARAAVRGGCDLGDPTAVLIREGDQTAADGRLLVRWDLAADVVLEGPSSPPSAAYRSFLAGLRARRVVTDPGRALARSPTPNNRIVLVNARRWIKPATCLEKYLYGLQHTRVSTFAEPTEFSSFVLASPDNRRERIYWYSVNRNGIGNASPLTDPVKADVAAGWRVRFVLHSHPFKPSDDTLNGIIAPSEPDAHFQMNMRAAVELPEARITNGVDTVRMPAASFPQFKAE